MKQILLSCLTLLVLSGQTTVAQHFHDTTIRCGTTQYMEMMIQQDPSIKDRMEQLEQMTNQWIEQNAGVKSPQEIFLTIPVVVHVVWNTSSENIPDEQIFSQIDVLNEDFRRLNEDTINTPEMFLGVAADVEIEFCMAGTDPDGNPTNGITRTETTISSFPVGNTMKFASSGGQDAWPTDQYLNIWICDIESGILGFSPYPGGSPSTDGIVVDYQNFGYNSPGGGSYNLGRTATHEIGHWLNLIHIWGDDGGGCVGTDYVSDTPNQGSEYYGCPSFPQTSCGSEDMFQNYMDYTDDDCMNIFTSGQKNRMQAAINFYRSGLFDSEGCNILAPVAGFTANFTQVPLNCGVDFTDLSEGFPTAWNWTFEGGTPATSTEQHPTGIIWEEEGSFTVSLEVENEAGTNTI